MDDEPKLKYAERPKKPEVFSGHERLDVSVDGADISAADRIVVVATGFGTDRSKKGTFDQIAETLADNVTSVVQFSYSGFGESEGDQRPNHSIR